MLGAFKRSAIREISRDACSTKSVIADRRLDTGSPRSPVHQFPGIGLGQGPVAKRLRASIDGAEEGTVWRTSKAICILWRPLMLIIGST